MLFDSEPYMLFLPAVVGINWLLPSRLRPGFLLLASYVFYASWNPPYLLLILALTVFNYFVGRAQSERTPRSRQLFLLALLGNLLVLGTFKYLGWLDRSAESFARVLGLSWTPPLIQLVLPIGLSFFTFEFLHYQIDLFRGTEAIRDPIRFALFPAFFPTQVSGPIKRYEDFDEQVRSQPRFNSALFLEGVELVALGLFKKTAIADSLQHIPLVVSSAALRPTALDAWLGSLAFYVELYFDFSGYTDIARGSAQMLGYRIPFNFNAPFIAAGWPNIWQRWHMSLTFWLRDYVFAPFASSRRPRWLAGRTRLIAAVMTTTIVCGLWHGAAGHYVLFGVILGLDLVVDRILQVKFWRRVKNRRLAFYGLWTQTFLLILLSFPPFFGGVRGALHIWKAMFAGGFGFRILNAFDVIQVVAIFVTTIAIQVFLKRVNVRDVVAKLDFSTVLRPAYVTALASTALYFAVTGAAFTLSTPGFIYFQF